MLYMAVLALTPNIDRLEKSGFNFINEHATRVF